MLESNKASGGVEEEEERGEKERHVLVTRMARIRCGAELRCQLAGSAGPWRTLLGCKLSAD